MRHRANVAPCRTEISRFESISMATIKTRQRKDGSLAYLSEVRVKRDGEIVHRESRTFDRLAQTNAWAESREKKFAKESPTAKRPQRVKQATLRHVLRRYREEVSEVRPMGRSKTSHIRFLEKREIARMTPARSSHPTSLPMCDQDVSLAPVHRQPTMTLSGCE